MWGCPWAAVRQPARQPVRACVRQPRLGGPAAAVFLNEVREGSHGTLQRCHSANAQSVRRARACASVTCAGPCRASSVRNGQISSVPPHQRLTQPCFACCAGSTGHACRQHWRSQQNGTFRPATSQHSGLRESAAPSCSMEPRAVRPRHSNVMAGTIIDGVRLRMQEEGVVGL